MNKLFNTLICLSSLLLISACNTSEGGNGSTPQGGGTQTSEPASDVMTYIVSFYNDDVLYDSKEVNEGELVSKPTDPSKDRYDFVGWYNSYTFEEFDFDTPIYDDYDLYAEWTLAPYNLSITSEDNAIGSVSIVSGIGIPGENITITATPIGEAMFEGWFENNVLLSEEETYTFVMPERDVAIIGKFYSSDEIQWRIAHGAIPHLIEPNKLTYGLYPNSYVSDASVIATLESTTPSTFNGWTLYDGEYYASKVATPANNIKFSDDTPIVNGTKYWFKCEPIVWEIKQDMLNGYLLYSEMTIDAQRFYNGLYNRTIDGKTVYANNYQYSDIRAWLNDEFFNTAFKLDNSYIRSAEVSNSLNTMKDGTNELFAGNTTIDKVFLPSYKDMVNSIYGYSSDDGNSETRYVVMSDYSRVSGTIISGTESLRNNAYYYIRSPGEIGSTVGITNPNGSLSSSEVNSVRTVRPAIRIKNY